jgi:hypothetical protein
MDKVLGFLFDMDGAIFHAGYEIGNLLDCNQALIDFIVEKIQRAFRINPWSIAVLMLGTARYTMETDLQGSVPKLFPWGQRRPTESCAEALTKIHQAVLVRLPGYKDRVILNRVMLGDVWYETFSPGQTFKLIEDTKPDWDDPLYDAVRSREFRHPHHREEYIFFDESKWSLYFFIAHYLRGCYPDAKQIDLLHFDDWPRHLVGCIERMKEFPAHYGPFFPQGLTYSPYIYRGGRGPKTFFERDNTFCGTGPLLPDYIECLRRLLEFHPFVNSYSVMRAGHLLTPEYYAFLMGRVNCARDKALEVEVEVEVEVGMPPSLPFYGKTRVERLSSSASGEAFAPLLPNSSTEKSSCCAIL